MAQTFVITKNSTLPNLRMEVINDGRYDFYKLYYAMQTASVTFTMTDLDKGIKKIANAEAFIVEKEGLSCEEGFVIEYRWKPRDTNTAGTYIGQFKITFDGNIKADGLHFPNGEMIVPIGEDLEIIVNDNMIKK